MKKKYKKIPSLLFMYEISSDGELRNIKSKRVLKCSKSSSGYRNCMFTQNSILKKHKKNKVYNQTLHRLVAECWLEKPKSIGYEINHKDGNKLNNNVENLEWVTHSQNIQHAYDKGLSKVSKQAIQNMENVNKDRRKKVLCIETNVVFPSAYKCAEWVMEVRDEKYIANLKNTATSISAVCKSKTRKVYKYSFKYI